MIRLAWLLVVLALVLLAVLAVALRAPASTAAAQRARRGRATGREPRPAPPRQGADPSETRVSVVAVAHEFTGPYEHVGKHVWTWCPGCDSLHPFTVETTEPGRPTWEWDGNLEAPTFSPSLLCYSSVHLCEGEHDPIVCPENGACGIVGDSGYISHALGHEVDGVLTWRFRDGIPAGAGPTVYGHGQPHTREPHAGNCHSFLRAGVWEFLTDSAHHLAGKSVPMVPLPAGWVE